MPRLFPDDFTQAQIRRMLSVRQQGPYVAVTENQHYFPKTKGIYFWYMRPEGYQILLRLIAFSINQVSAAIDLNGSYLVYIGTAGTRKTKNNQTGLVDRYKWHVCQKHSVASVKTGLSTFRQTLGALLADDLLGLNGPSTEHLIDDFMQNYLTVTYIAYDGELVEACSQIDADEHKLITTLKPLLNIKVNTNSRLMGHPTQQINARRKLITRNTRDRL